MHLNMRLIIIITALLLLAACSMPSFGGPASSAKGFGTGGTAPATGALQEVTYITARGSVIGESGRPLSGAEINARTKFGNEIVKTDAQGRFQIVLPVGSGKDVKFSITSGTSSGEVSSKGFGVGADVVLFHFKLMNNGKVIELTPGQVAQGKR